mmetsp:Transcript_12472/g.35361  ORF Transcript_12472/g.35361 Transcript_12472/m.35361 type:complete len:358 (-) Transcript_12472:24-1097(-)
MARVARVAGGGPRPGRRRLLARMAEALGVAGRLDLRPALVPVGVHLQGPGEEHGGGAVHDEVPESLGEAGAQDRVARAREVQEADHDHQDHRVREAEGRLVHELLPELLEEVGGDEGRPQHHEDEADELQRRGDHAVVGHDERRARQAPVVEQGDEVEVGAAGLHVVPVAGPGGVLETLDGAGLVQPRDVRHRHLGLYERHGDAVEEAAHADGEQQPLQEAHEPALPVLVPGHGEGLGMKIQLGTVVTVTSNRAIRPTEPVAGCSAGAPVPPVARVLEEGERGNQQQHAQEEQRQARYLPDDKETVHGLGVPPEVPEHEVRLREPQEGGAAVAERRPRPQGELQAPQPVPGTNNRHD